LAFFSVDMQLATRLTTKTTKLQHEYSPLWFCLINLFSTATTA